MHFFHDFVEKLDLMSCLCVHQIGAFKLFMQQCIFIKQNSFNSKEVLKSICFSYQSLYRIDWTQWILSKSSQFEIQHFSFLFPYFFHSHSLTSNLMQAVSAHPLITFQNHVLMMLSTQHSRNNIVNVILCPLFVLTATCLRIFNKNLMPFDTIRNWQMGSTFRIKFCYFSVFLCYSFGLAINKCNWISMDQTDLGEFAYFVPFFRSKINFAYFVHHSYSFEPLL